MSATQLEAESASMRRELRNHHTLFFVPMQWLGVAVVALGGFVIIGALVTSLR